MQTHPSRQTCNRSQNLVDLRWGDLNLVVILVRRAFERVQEIRRSVGGDAEQRIVLRQPDAADIGAADVTLVTQVRWDPAQINALTAASS